MQDRGQPITGSEQAHWMPRCIALADEARARGEVAVGAVIVCGGNAVAECSDAATGPQDVTAHAELLAIREVAKGLGRTDLSGCTLYTNVEPCWMCSFAIRESRISRVVIGKPVASIGGATSAYPILTVVIDGWSPPPAIVWLEQPVPHKRCRWKEI